MLDLTIQLWGVIGALLGAIFSVLNFAAYLWSSYNANKEKIEITPINFLGKQTNKFRVLNTGKKTVEIAELFWQKGDKQALIETGSFDFYDNDSMPSPDKPKIIKQGESICFDSASIGGCFKIPTVLIDKSVDIKKQIKQIKFCVMTSRGKIFSKKATKFLNRRYHE